MDNKEIEVKKNTHSFLRHLKTNCKHEKRVSIYSFFMQKKLKKTFYKEKNGMKLIIHFYLMLQKSMDIDINVMMGKKDLGGMV